MFYLVIGVPLYYNYCHYVLLTIIFLYSAFYSVLLGYCCYYSFFFMATELPDNLETAELHFDDLLVIKKSMNKKINT